MGQTFAWSLMKGIELEESVWVFVGRQLSCFPASPSPAGQLISINYGPKNTFLRW